MAKPQYNTEVLIANIKRRCLVPTSQLTYQDVDWCRLADDVMQDEVVPLIMSAREEYFVDFIDVNVPESRAIDIPAEAVGEKLRSVCYVQQGSPLVLVNIPRVDLDVVAGVGFVNNMTFAGFYVQGSQLMLYPNSSVPVGTQIRIYYFKRSLSLADNTSYGQVQTVDLPMNTVTLNYVPATWATGTVLNSVSQTAPFKTTSSEFTIVNVSAPSIIVDDATGISAGDYISDQGYSAIPQIPIEAQAYLAQLTAAKALEGLGDREGMKAALTKAEAMKTGLLTVISQRVDGSVKKLVNPNGGLRLSSSGYWGGNGRGWW